MTQTKSEFQFEPAMKELEAIAVWFEGSQVNLDEGLTKFERGMELAQQLKTHLEVVGNRVEKVKAKFDQPVVEVGSSNDIPVDYEDESSEPGLF